MSVTNKSPRKRRERGFVRDQTARPPEPGVVVFGQRKAKERDGGGI